MTDIAGVVMLTIGMFGLGFLACLYLVFDSNAWRHLG